MSLKTPGIWHPCTNCWAEIEGLVNITGKNLCPLCAYVYKVTLQTEEQSNVVTTTDVSGSTTDASSMEDTDAPTTY